MKFVYKVIALLLTVNCLSVANADTCLEEYQTYRFNNALANHDIIRCSYYIDYMQYISYEITGYKPSSGPWKGSPKPRGSYFCMPPASECQFQKV